MADLALSGPLNQAVQDIMDMVAACGAWQTWTGTDNATDAAAYVFPFCANEDETVSPICVVEGSEQFGQNAISEGAPATYMWEGGMMLIFQATVPSAYANRRSQLRNSITWIRNQVGGVLTDLKALEGMTSIASWRIADGPWRTDRQPDLVGITIELEIGL